MAKLSVAPNVLYRGTSDPGYQALRLRGLAGLLRATGSGLQELTNLPEVMFFLSSELDEIAAALDGGN